MKRNNFTVVNSLPISEGIIPRRRNKNRILEESVLDFFVVCQMVLPYVTRMVIDESKEYVPTNYYPAKISGKAIVKKAKIGSNYYLQKPENFYNVSTINLLTCQIKKWRYIFKMKMKIARSKQSSNWNTKDFEKALCDLKNEKSRDFEGYINKIF